MRTILVVIDREGPDNPAFARACALAGENCADLCILRLRDTEADRGGSQPHEQFMAVIGAARAHHPCIGSIAASSAGSTAGAIGSAAEAAGADLIVMRNTIESSIPHDAPFALIDRVVHRTALPVLAVQNPVDRQYRRLVALIGRGAIGEQALELALRVKSARDIYAVRARHDPPGDDAALLDRLVATTVANRPEVSVAIHPVVRDGDVETALIRTWQDYRPDLVVAITHRRRGLRGLFGSSHVRDLLVDMPFDLLIQEAASAQEKQSRRRVETSQAQPVSSSSIPAG